MIRPKHYNYHNRSQPAQRERTTLTISGKKNHSKAFTLRVLSGTFLKSEADVSLNTMPLFTMRSLNTLIASH